MSSKRRRTYAAVALVLVSVAGRTANAGTASSWEWEEVPRVVAIGDVHGAHDNLLRLLRALGLVDATLTWLGGQTHVVFCGDLVDRGPADRAVVDLVRHLQAEARAAGGRVHALLGNHEVMNLIGDLRYVNPEALAEFAAEETEMERRAGWERFQSEHKRHEPGIQASFAEQFPRGYFARERLFGPNGEYGAWLLEQPTIVKINGVVFVHGGLTKEVAALGLVGINRGVREGVLEWLERRRPTEMFGALPFAPWGPLWYRGYSLENERIVRDSLSEVLAGLGARALVVGHTPTQSERITARFNGRLYRVDTGMGYGADPEALVLEGEEAWVFDPDTFARSGPLLEPPQGEGWSPVREELPDEQLEQFLARAKVAGSREIVWGDQHLRLVELQRKGLHLHGIFQFVEEQPEKDIPPESFNPRRYQHEVAAYHLDRMLGLGMVPVAVLRKVDRQPGALSYWLSSAIDLPYIREHGRRDLIVALERQIAEARIFTALVGTRDRDDAAKMLIPPERRIMIADNSKGFPLNTEIQDLLVLELGGFHLEVCDMGASLELALRELDRESLQAELGDYISATQIEALLVRRDRILEACSLTRQPELLFIRSPAVGNLARVFFI